MFEIPWTQYSSTLAYYEIGNYKFERKNIKNRDSFQEVYSIYKDGDPEPEYNALEKFQFLRMARDIIDKIKNK